MALPVQVCTIVLMLSVMFIYHKQLYIHTELNRIFERLLLLLIAVSMCDVLIFIINYNSAGENIVATNVLLRLFNVCLVLYVFAIRDYIFKCIRVPDSQFSFILRAVLCVLVAMLPPLLEINYFGFVSAGTGMWITLDIVFAVVLYVLIVMYINRQFISKPLKVSLILWAVLFVISVVVNYAIGLNFITFACAMGSVWLFYTIENPKAKVDDASGFFTSYVLLDYLDSLPNQSAHIGIIYVQDCRLDTDLLKALLKNTKVCCFRDNESFYYLVGEDFDELFGVLRQYREQYDVIMLTYKNATVDVLSTLSSFVHQHVAHMKESVIKEISNQDISKVTQDNKMHLEVVSALMEGRVETYIQPIYDMNEKKFTSGECLCRLKKRDGTLIYPNDFIPVAERTGLITEIETAMFRNMCKCLATEDIRSSHIKYLEANLSIKKGEQHNLLSEYSDILTEFDVGFDKINLEITETDVVEEKRSILNNMHAMRSMGFNFSLDDFGTGESNLGYIIDMPVSIIKFDKEITQKAMRNEKAFTIVSNVMKMAHELGIKVVVEGVETKDDFKMCERLQADYIQGYYFSKPLAMPDFIEFIKNNNK